MAETNPTSQLDLIDVHATHDLFQMPGGPETMAIGAQWFKEAHDETPPAAIESGAQGGDSIYVIGTEYDRAAFVELDGNPIKSLNINLQGRYDNYKDFGSERDTEGRIPSSLPGSGLRCAGPGAGASAYPPRRRAYRPVKHSVPAPLRIRACVRPRLPARAFTEPATTRASVMSR